MSALNIPSVSGNTLLKQRVRTTNLPQKANSTNKNNPNNNNNNVKEEEEEEKEVEA